MIEIGKTNPANGKPTLLRRVTRESYGHSHKKRKLVVTLEPVDLITINEYGCRSRHSARVWDIYQWMLRSVAQKAYMEKLRLKKQRKAERLARQRLATADRRFRQKIGREKSAG